MMRKRILAVLATASAELGLAVGLTMPVSHADPLPNGYDVSCKQANSHQVVCSIGGCPQVGGDVVHTSVDGQPQHEIGQSCGATITQTVETSSGFNYAVQGCSKHTVAGDTCGAWSDYKYTPPAAPAAPAEPQTKQCPDGGPTIPVAQACPVMNVQKAGLQVNVTVGNTSDLSAECTYDATEANGLGLPVHRDFSLAAKGSTTLTFPAPLIGQSWQLVAACNAPFEGQTVEIGRANGSA